MYHIHPSIKFLSETAFLSVPHHQHFDAPVKKIHDLQKQSAEFEIKMQCIYIYSNTYICEDEINQSELSVRNYINADQEL